MVNKVMAETRIGSVFAIEGDILYGDYYLIDPYLNGCNHMKRKLIFFIYLFYFLVIPFTVSAETPVIVKVGVYENFPKIFTGDDGIVKGPWADIMEYIGTEENWQIQWVSGTWAQGLQRLKSGEINIMPDTGWTEPRSRQYAFSGETVLVSWSRMYVPENSDIRSIVDLDGKTVAVLKGSFNFEGPEGIKEIVHKFNLNVVFKTMDSYGQIFKALDRGRIDAGVTNKDFGNQHEDEYAVERTAIIFQPARMQFAFTKGAGLTSYLMEKIDGHMKKLKVEKNSIYYASLEKYIGGQAGQTFIEIIPVWVKVMLTVCIGVIFLLLLFGIALRVQVGRRTFELRESEKNLSITLDSIGDAVIATDIKGRVVRMNPVAENLTGWTLEKAQGMALKEVFNIVNARTKKSMVNPVRQVLETGKIVGLANHTLLLSKNDDKYQIADSAAPIQDDTGSILGVVLVFRDVTKEYQMREAVFEREQHLRSIFRAAPTGIGMVVNRVFKQVNGQICEMTGYCEEELIGQNARMIYPSDREYESVGREKYKQIKAHGTGTVETCWQHKDKHIINIQLSSTPLDINDLSRGVTFTALDITKRKQAEKALSESEERFRMLFDEAPDAIFLIDMDDHLLDANIAASKMLGYTRGEYKTMTVSDLQPPEIREKVGGVIKKELTLGKVFEGVDMCRDGTVIPIEIHNHKMFVKGREIVLSLVRDITERKRSEEELRKIETQLMQAQKMESIGTLAGGIAHDFNNILSGIMGYAQLAEIDINNAAKEYIIQIINSTKRAAELVQQILTFSRQSEYQKQPLAIYTGVNEVLKLLRSTIPTTIEIKTKIDSEAMVLADSTKIHQLIMNLCTNAYHAMGETGGLMTVELTDIDISRPIMLKNKKIPKGKYIKLEVRDTGHGMDEKILEKAFEPYFTTKRIGRGTGLGLALVQAIVAEHDGFIDVYSEPGKGTHFYIYLPVVRKKIEQHTSSIKKMPFLKGNENIMFVDDEEPIRKITKEFLEKYGYSVSLFENGIDAYKAFEKNPYQFDLAITDMTMPGMAGNELAANLLKVRSDLPILLCTGFSENISEETADTIGIRGFLYKPVSMKDIARKIRTILDGDSKKNKGRN